MKKNKVYLFSSSMCPDCPRFEKYLNDNEIKFAKFDISESLGALKRFLFYRDSLKAFESVKATETIGIPAIILNEELAFLDLNDIDESILLELKAHE
ncbi:glutaredoxin domain-containing protein [Citroniella saccharovorans]|uniref:Glutaredoxin domain-containing protein n=1 Tax=Citroniella saccharovorans TaxID=2053367 RepID=A0AAW9MMN0_9FIRM|nr:glutaredoxin domain-containing protein [Citroniella saccharovorans]MEB3428768.1 glutaredoxin domain-containing protein [Citroniella saccharovorans]